MRQEENNRKVWSFPIFRKSVLLKSKRKFEVIFPLYQLLNPLLCISRPNKIYYVNLNMQIMFGNELFIKSLKNYDLGSLIQKSRCQQICSRTWEQFARHLKKAAKPIFFGLFSFLSNFRSNFNCEYEGSQYNYSKAVLKKIITRYHHNLILGISKKYISLKMSVNMFQFFHPLSMPGAYWSSSSIPSWNSFEVHMILAEVRAWTELRQAFSSPSCIV